MSMKFKPREITPDGAAHELATAIIIGLCVIAAVLVTMTS